jgi:hypothetical protein
MWPASVALLAALAAAGPDPAGEPLVAQALAPPVLAALPSPPETVVRVTQRYGTVAIDHRQHLAARASCRGCHGPGPVGKVVLGGPVAHERCVGCHRERARGPVHCAGCHAKAAAPVAANPSPPPAERVAVAPALPQAVQTTPATLAAPSGGAAAGPAPREVAPAGPRRPGVQLLEAGLAAGPGLGFSLRVTSTEGALVRAYGFDRLDDGARPRMLGHLGLGLAHAPAARVRLVALAVGGFDAEERPRLGLVPALGARVGLSLAPPAGWLVRTVDLSVTALADVRLAGALGHHGGGGRLFATLAMGLPVPGR